MASRTLKVVALGASTIVLFSFLKKLKELKKRKEKLMKSKQYVLKLRRKIKADRPVKLQKSTLELYDSDSEAQRAKRPRIEEEEVEKSEDESIESIESSSDSESSDESCYSSLISNTETNSTHSESFITDTDEELDKEDSVGTENNIEALQTEHVKPEVFDDPLATINYDEEDRKPDLDELTEALRNADNSATNATSSIRIKEEPRYY